MDKLLCLVLVTGVVFDAVTCQRGLGADMGLGGGLDLFGQGPSLFDAIYGLLTDSPVPNNAPNMLDPGMAGQAGQAGGMPVDINLLQMQQPATPGPNYFTGGASGGLNSQDLLLANLLMNSRGKRGGGGGGEGGSGAGGGGEGEGGGGEGGGAGGGGEGEGGGSGSSSSSMSSFKKMLRASMLSQMGQRGQRGPMNQMSPMNGMSQMGARNGIGAMGARNGMSQMGLMGQMSQMGPMNRNGQMSPMNQMGPMGQMGQMGPMNRNGQMGPMNPMVPMTPVGQMGQISQMNRNGQMRSVNQMSQVGQMGRNGQMGRINPMGPMGPMSRNGQMSPTNPMNQMSRNGQMSPTNPMNQMSRNGQMGPINPVGPMGPMNRNGQMGSMNQINRMGQMGQMSQMDQMAKLAAQLGLGMPKTKIPGRAGAGGEGEGGAGGEGGARAGGGEGGASAGGGEGGAAAGGGEGGAAAGGGEGGGTAAGGGEGGRSGMEWAMMALRNPAFRQMSGNLVSDFTSSIVRLFNGAASTLGVPLGNRRRPPMNDARATMRPAMTGPGQMAGPGTGLPGMPNTMTNQLTGTKLSQRDMPFFMKNNELPKGMSGSMPMMPVNRMRQTPPFFGMIPVGIRGMSRMRPGARSSGMAAGNPAGSRTAWSAAGGAPNGGAVSMAVTVGGKAALMNTGNSECPEYPYAVQGGRVLFKDINLACQMSVDLQSALGQSPSNGIVPLTTGSTPSPPLQTTTARNNAAALPNTNKTPIAEMHTKLGGDTVAMCPPWKVWRQDREIHIETVPGKCHIIVMSMKGIPGILGSNSVQVRFANRGGQTPRSI